MKEKKTSYLTVLGFIIRARRENSGLTRHQFAEITGFSESWLKKIESGFVAISIDRLRQIASCYQTNACTLIEDADQLKEELEAQGIKVKESIVNKESDILYKTISENTKGKTGAVSIASSLSTLPTCQVRLAFLWRLE